MEARSPVQRDFWEEVTDQICATIAKEFFIYDSDCLDRIFAETERHGERLPSEPSLGQVAEDTGHAKSVGLGLTTDCHAKVTDFGEESSEDMAIELHAGADFDPLNLVSSSSQILVDLQRVTSDSEPAHSTPTRMPEMSQSSSRTITPGMFSDAPTSMARQYLNGSPTPAVATTIEDYEPASSPTTPAANTDVKSPKRKLSFGMPVFGDDDEVRMPPPKLRKASSTIEHQTFSDFVNADAVENTRVDITFKDIQCTSTAYDPSENEVPKTPTLVDFGMPSSPVVIVDETEESYPVCADGFFFEQVPVHHLRSLRKKVDPTFQDDLYWGDGLYFLDHPAPSIYGETESSGVHSLDWRIIFHALDNNADRRIPLPNTTTMPRMTDEQLQKMGWKFEDGDKKRAIFQAQMPRGWRQDRTSEAGAKWTEVRGAYHRDPPEFTTRSSQDICADPEFRFFCSLAQFIKGRPAVMPQGLALKSTHSVLKYARLANRRRQPQIDALLRQQMELVPQHPILESPAPLHNDANVLQDDDVSHPLRSPSLAAPQDPPPTLVQPTQTSNQIPGQVQTNTSLVSRAFHDMDVFMKEFPPAGLVEMARQYMHLRAQKFISQSLPIPMNTPTAFQLWNFFRQRLHFNSVARAQQAAREAAASAVPQASTPRNSFVGKSGTPVSSRSVQLHAHMPTTPGSRGGGLQGGGTGSVAANVLGSPFRTPARMRSGSVDPRLLHS